jgi:hypothetical protein
MLTTRTVSVNRHANGWTTYDGMNTPLLRYTDYPLKSGNLALRRFSLLTIMYEIVLHDVVMHSDGDLDGIDFRDHFAIDIYSILPLTSHVEDRAAVDNDNNIVEKLSPPDDRAELQGQVGINRSLKALSQELGSKRKRASTPSTSPKKNNKKSPKVKQKSLLLTKKYPAVKMY